MKTNMQVQTVTRQTVKQMIKGARLANAENKGTVVSSPGNAVTAGGAVFNVTPNIIQGDTVSTRDGSQINLNKVCMRFETQGVAVSGITRVIVLQDHQNNGVVPGVTDILDNANVISPLNVLNFVTNKRFKLLSDDLINCNIAGQNLQFRKHMWSKALSKQVTYNAATNVAAANGRNAIFMLVIGTATNTFDFSFQLDFLDQ
jgi:hypothetical protein